MTVIGHALTDGATICVDCAERVERADDLTTADAIHGTDRGCATLDCTDCGNQLLDLEEYEAHDSWGLAA